MTPEDLFERLGVTKEEFRKEILYHGYRLHYVRMVAEAIGCSEDEITEYKIDGKTQDVDDDAFDDIF